METKVELDHLPFLFFRRVFRLEQIGDRKDKLIMAVEPFWAASSAALDPEMINEVLDVMVTLAKDGMTMIVVTHEMGFARKVANRVVFMDKGEIVEDSPTADFFGKPRSERAQMFLSKILQQ